MLYCHSNNNHVCIHIEIHNNGLQAKVKFSFCLDIGRITGNFHFSIVPMGTLGVYI